VSGPLRAGAPRRLAAARAALAAAGVALAARAGAPGRLAAARAALAARPRHVALFALVAGLLLGPLSAVALLAGVLLALAVVRPPWLALLAAVGALTGATLAEARLAAIDDGPLRAMVGERVAARAVLLEPLRQRTAGPPAGRVRLLTGPARGEQAVLRVRVALAAPPPVGAVLALRGEVAPRRRW